MNPIDPKTLRHPVIHKGLNPTANHPTEFSKVNWLCNIADQMEVGDAVELTMSESGTMRVILQARGFKCVTDAWQCKTKTNDRRMILVFKLKG